MLDKVRKWLLNRAQARVWKKIRALPCEGKHPASVLGNTFCDECTPLYEALYPQGWASYPGDVCEHGVYVGGCGADYMCGPCEMGYSPPPKYEWQLVKLALHQLSAR